MEKSVVKTISYSLRILPFFLLDEYFMNLKNINMDKNPPNPIQICNQISIEWLILS